MNLVQKIRARGWRALGAAAFRRLASVLDAPSPAPAAGPARPAGTERWSGYLERLNYAIPGWLDRGNIDAMSHALRHLPGDAPIVEIGSFHGLSTCVLTHLKQVHAVKNQLFTCDRWASGEPDPTKKIDGSAALTYEEFSVFGRDSFVRNAGFFCRSDLPHTVELFSDEFFAAWRMGETMDDVFGRRAELGGPIAFCYIDGNHSYDFAKRDFENTDQHLVTGGFILFDDSSDGNVWADVGRVVAEVGQSGRYALVGKYPNYLFQKR